MRNKARSPEFIATLAQSSNQRIHAAQLPPSRPSLRPTSRRRHAHMSCTTMPKHTHRARTVQNSRQAAAFRVIGRFHLMQQRTQAGNAEHRAPHACTVHRYRPTASCSDPPERPKRLGKARSRKCPLHSSAIRHRSIASSYTSASWL
eukprot:UN3716